MLAVLFAFFTGLPHLGYFSSSNFLVTAITWFSGMILVVVPIIFLIFLLVRIFSDYRVKKKIKNTMIGTWIASVILFIFCFAFQIPNYANDSQISESRQLQIEDNLIKIKFEDFESDDEFMVSLGDTYINKDALYGDNIRVSIYKSDSAHITLEKEISSQGRTRSNARKYASKVNIDEKIEGNIIFIPEYYRIDKGDKYRGQDVRFKIYIPKNKRVEVDRNMRWTIRKNEFTEKD